LTRHRLEGLSCPVCAAKIEDRIKESGLKGRIDFSSQSLILENEDLDRIQRIISSVEPGVRIVESSDRHNRLRTLIPILVAGSVFLLASIVDDFLHGQYEILEYSIYILAYVIAGSRVLSKAFRNAVKGRFFDENFLMTVATVGALLIHELPEAVAVMLLFNIGEFFEGLAVSKSRKSILALVDLKAEMVSQIIDGKIISVKASEIRIGDSFIVKPGERIPVDGVVVAGDTWLDVSHISGESRPVKVARKSVVYAGSINTSGLIEVEATASLEKSYTSRMLQMVEDASSRKATTERLITRFSRVYTPIVVLSAIFLALIPPLLFGGNFAEWIRRALILLVISCPCALVISIPLGYFAGIGRASKNGILIKGSNYLEALTMIDTVIFDKTGTLTEGRFKVTEVTLLNGKPMEEVLGFAAAVESYSNHPIARSIMEFVSSNGLNTKKFSVSGFSEHPGKGVTAKVDGKTVGLGNQKLLKDFNLIPPYNGSQGNVFLVVDGRLLCVMKISDSLKSDSKTAIELLRRQGIRRIVMLTGDEDAVANSISQELSLDDYGSGLTPQGKILRLEELAKSGRRIAFVGDGINDAPAIIRANVGFAMGNAGSDAAIETADVVVSNDSPLQIPKALAIAEKTRSIVIQNIIFALGVKGLFIFLGAFGLANMWGAVFADVGVTMIAIVNSLRILSDKLNT